MRQQTYEACTTPAQPMNSAAPTMSLPSPQSEGAQDKPLVLMTMAEWKRVPRDFKGSHIGPDGKRWRSVLRPGGMVAVEIIK